MNAEIKYKTMKLRELNSLLGSKEDFYNRLSVRGFFLPNRDKKCITSEYLLGVLTGKFFSLKRDQVKIPFPTKKASKLDILRHITDAIKPKELGLKITHLPNRSWMETVLFTVKPDHSLFKKPAMIIPEREFQIPDW
jgi:hypothetical protein